jgi:hypothetical protein
MNAVIRPWSAEFSRIVSKPLRSLWAAVVSAARQSGGFV